MFRLELIIYWLNLNQTKVLFLTYEELLVKISNVRIKNIRYSFVRKVNKLIHT